MLNHLRHFEPARLQALKVAVFGVLAVLGVTVPADVDGRIAAGLTVLAGVLALFQGETTRRRVRPAVEHGVRAVEPDRSE